MSTSHRARSAEYADAALTCRMMAEALELRAAEELALARKEEIEAEERAAAGESFRRWIDAQPGLCFGASISVGVSA